MAIDDHSKGWDDAHSYLTKPLGEVFEWWTQDKSDNRVNVTLEQLLAFTSGLDHEGDHNILGLCPGTNGLARLEDCAKEAHDNKTWNGVETEMDYGGSHLTVAFAYVE